MQTNVNYTTTVGGVPSSLFPPPLGNFLTNVQTGQEIPLAMQHLDLSGRVSPAGALLRITHSFKCEGEKPMEALYTFMLPRNGVLRRFVVKGEDFEVESKLSAREEARKEYEEGMKEGHLSVLAETNSDGIISLSVGQVRPDEKVTVMMEIVSGVDAEDKRFRFRFPFTLAPSYHAQAKATATATGGSLELPKDVFGDLILPEWKNDASGLHQISFRLHVEPGGVLDAVASPSHRVLVRPNADGSADVELAGNADVPNRDLVIDVLAKEGIPVLYADEALIGQKAPSVATPPTAPRWMISLPSTVIPKAQMAPRRVCFVVDRSGSMQGQAIERAKAALKACLSALSPTDEFGLVQFDTVAEAFDEKMATATDANRKQAAKFIEGICARGGTELACALGKAVDVLNGPGGDIFLLTDGEVFETGTIIEQAAAAGTRIHVLGIGSASQDRFLAALSRRTDGVQKMVGLNEDVGTAALGLFSSVRQPVQTDVKALVEMSGSGAPQTFEIGTVWDGKAILITDKRESGDYLPVKVGLMWGKAPDNTVVALPTPRASLDGLVALLHAGQQVEDLESAMDMAKTGPARKAIERDLKELSTLYSLASRVMSLCAVIHRIGDKAEDAEQRQVAVGLPEGMVVGGVFMAQSALHSSGLGGMASVNYCSTGGSFGSSVNSGHSKWATIRRKVGTKSAMLGGGGGGILRGMAFTLPGVYSDIDDGARGLDNSVEEQTSGSILSLDSMEVGEVTVDCCAPCGPATSSPFALYEQSPSGAVTPKGFTPQRPQYDVLSLMGTLEADGGVSGRSESVRYVLTVLLALAALSDEAQMASPIYKAHRERMAAYISSKGDNTRLKDLIRQVAAIIAAGGRKVGDTDWLQVFDYVKNVTMDDTVGVKQAWEKIEAALKA